MLSKLHIFGERRQLGLLPKQRQKGRQIQAYLSFFPFVEIQPEFLKCDQYEGSLLAVRKKNEETKQHIPVVCCSISSRVAAFILSCEYFYKCLEEFFVQLDQAYCCCFAVYFVYYRKIRRKCSVGYCITL